MFTIEVKDKENRKVKDLTLPEEVFGYPVKKHLMWEVVKAFLANRRSGNAATKTRAMVSGGGKKPWKQKGRGTARSGSTRSTLWRHGGVSFGPQPRSYGVEIPKKMRRSALKSALSSKFHDKEMLVVDDLLLTSLKTKDAMNFLKKMELSKVLIVDNGENRNLQLSTRNIPDVKSIDYREINVYEVLKYKNLLFSEKGLVSLLEVLK